MHVCNTSKSICFERILGAANTGKDALELSLWIETPDTGRSIPVKALVDSGATGNFANLIFVQENEITTSQLSEPITVKNADGSLNRGGPITAACNLWIKSPEFRHRTTLEVVDLGSSPFDIILGFPWLKENNPDIDWTTGILHWSSPRPTPLSAGLPLPREDSHLLRRIEAKAQLALEPGFGITPAKLTFDFLRDPILINAMTLLGDKSSAEADMRKFIPEEYWKYDSVFLRTGFDQLPPHSEDDHAINLREDFKPQKGSIYALSPAKKVALDEFLEEHLSTGRIRPSKSPQAASFFFVDKEPDINKPDSNPGLRPTQDYRYLNAHTIRDQYPLPRMSAFFQDPVFKESKYFTVMDIRWGFNNIRIKEGDEWKAAFTTPRGLFEPTVMFFGLCNSPASFQRMIDRRFKRVLQSGHVFFYMDDCIIFAHTLEELRYWTHEVLAVMQATGLSCKPSKCQFEKETVKYLGNYLTEGATATNPLKVAAILDWPTPTKLRDVESFLGTCNFWRRFIFEYSHIALPLNKLRRKDTPFVWTPSCQSAFDALKHAITSAPVLRAPDRSLPYILETDSSGFAYSGILMQEFSGALHPVGFFSKTLTEAERNYPTPDQELLAIVKSLEEWRDLLEGASTAIKVRSDNQSLRTFLTNKLLSRRQARWSEFLSRFDFTIEHIPGKRNRADGLSRRPDYDPHGIYPELQKPLLSPSVFINEVITLPAPDFMSRLRHPYPLIRSLSERLTDASTDLSLDDGIVRDAAGRIMVPPDVSVCTDIIRLTHSSTHVGHPGIEKTLDLIRRSYFWDGMRRDVTHFVRTCPTCQQTKLFPRKPVGLLQPLPIPDSPWQTITVDLIVELPLSDGYDAIMVVVDKFTKRAHFLPTTTHLSAEGAALLFRDNVWRHHGWPSTIVSDRGTQFAAHFSQALNALLGIKTSLSTSYHPQTDGQTERVNQDLEQYLRLFTNFAQTDWNSWLALAEFAYNNRIHSATNYSPFFLEYGRHPRLPTDPLPAPVIVPAANDFYDSLADARTAAHASLEMAASLMKKYADRKRQTLPEFEIGSLVYLDARNLKTGRPAKKLDVRNTGPFPVIGKIPGDPCVAYRLQLPPTWRVHPVFHVSLLRPARVDNIIHPLSDDTLRPPPDVIDGVEQYEVEAILAHRGPKRRHEYLAKWRGYPPSKATWLTNAQCSGCRDLTILYEDSLKR